MAQKKTKKPTTKGRKLSVKQKKFVKAYASNGGNGTKAALEAYDVTDEGTASVIAVENLRKPSIKEQLEKAFEEHGITIKSATQPIRDGLKAEREIFADGELTGTKPDHMVRLRASQMALKFMGAEDKEGGGDKWLLSSSSTFPHLPRHLPPPQPLRKNQTTWSPYSQATTQRPHRSPEDHERARV